MIRRPTNYFTLLCLTAFVSGCAAHPDPIVDMKGVDQKKFDQDWQECDKYTEEIVIAEGVAKGTATGAAVGAISGAISGDVGEGAAYGGLYGGTRSGLDADEERQRVFKRCLRGRGYKVLN
jgi:outer membrane lipoprotein SlyB